MFGRRAWPAAAAADLDRVEELVRARFELGPDCLVMVSQLPTRQPGFPPLETRVLFWTDDGPRHRLRLFKPVAEVRAADLPLRWLRPGLIDDGDSDCC